MKQDRRPSERKPVTSWKESLTRRESRSDCPATRRWTVEASQRRVDQHTVKRRTAIPGSGRQARRPRTAASRSPPPSPPATKHDRRSSRNRRPSLPAPQPRSSRRTARKTSPSPHRQQHARMRRPGRTAARKLLPGPFRRAAESPAIPPSCDASSRAKYIALYFR